MRQALRLSVTPVATAAIGPVPVGLRRKAATAETSSAFHTVRSYASGLPLAAVEVAKAIPFLVALQLHVVPAPKVGRVTASKA